MSSNDWRKLGATLIAPEQGTIAFEGDGVRKCLKCGSLFSKDSELMLCPIDGLLLMRINKFDNLIENKLNASISSNRYKIEHWLGEGELTNVFSAQDNGSKEQRVVKVIKSHLLVESKRIRRFADMLNELSALQHPNIISVMDSGIAKASERAIPQVFFVVEKLEGSKNLKVILNRHGPIAPYVVIETMMQVCNTLDDAANMGWLHQDLKPSNIYISMRGEEVSVKISDFGISARMFPFLEWESQSTETGSMYGNVNYTSPDKTYGMEPSVASDVYALGCTIYHVLKGMAPFEGDNDFVTLLMHRDKQPKPFAEELKIPKELEAIVMKCMQKKPEERYQSFKQLAADLNGIKSIST